MDLVAQSWEEDEKSTISSIAAEHGLSSAKERKLLISAAIRDGTVNIILKLR